MKDKRMAVYLLLKRIPKGKVTTYGAIGRKLGMNPRHVGRILGENEHPSEYPCYKVVRADGSLGGYTVSGKNNAFTLSLKKKKLKRDGVSFNGNKVEKSRIIAV